MEDDCYTTHAGVVISLGWNTPVYTYISDKIPEAHKLIVDVAELLPAPPRHQRIKHECFPDAAMVSRIQRQKGFEEALALCESVLQIHGIVLVLCKGGNHRSPTVANSMKQPGRIVIHSTLFTRPPFCGEHIATLVHACIKCENSLEFYSELIRNSKDSQQNTQLCVGWNAGNVETQKVDTKVPFLSAGAEVEVLDTCDHSCLVKDKTTGCSCELPVTWLLHKHVYMRREM